MYTQNTINAEIAKRISAPATREIDFSNATMEQKITTLKNLGGAIDEEKDYKVNRTFEINANETATAFAERVKNFVTLLDVLEIVNGKKTAVTITANVKGKNLSQKQQIAVLSEQVKTDGKKVVCDVLGGENFIAMLQYVRGLSEEEFTAMISAK